MMLHVQAAFTLQLYGLPAVYIYSFYVILIMTVIITVNSINRLVCVMGN
jgi:hypothetical protein